MMSRCTDTICRGSPLSTTADHLPCLICAAFGANRATFIVSAVSCSTVTPSGENRGVSGRFSMMTASDITAPSEGNRTTRHGSEGAMMVKVYMVIKIQSGTPVAIHDGSQQRVYMVIKIQSGTPTENGLWA